MSNGPVLVELWKDEVKKSSLEKLIKKIMDSIVQLLPIITPLLLDQFKCSLPKNVTTFHGQKDGINHFRLTPNKRGVLAL